MLPLLSRRECYVRSFRGCLLFDEVLAFLESMLSATRHERHRAGWLAGPVSPDLRRPSRDLLERPQGRGLVHAGAPKQVHRRRADLADEHAYRQVVPLS
jgi:hypothetical protein